MNALPPELLCCVTKYLSDFSKEKYCLFEDESVPLRLSCAFFHSELETLKPTLRLFKPCLSVADVCACLAEHEDACASYVYVQDWNVARRQCVHHAKIMPKPEKHDGFKTVHAFAAQPKFLSWEISVMQEFLQRLIEQIKESALNPKPDSDKLARLACPSLQFFSRFMECTRTWRVWFKHVRVCVTRVGAGNAEIMVHWHKDLKNNTTLFL